MNAVDIIPLIDLTSLNPDDNDASIVSLCEKAQTSYGPVAAVCVYSAFVKRAVSELKNTAIKIATVANFPAGNLALQDTLSLIGTAISDGANEIDMVFPYNLYLQGEKQKALDFVISAKKLCGNEINLKVILETGELPSLEVIKKISYDVLCAGADFIKTSTGKTKQGATLAAVGIMLKVINEQTVNQHRLIGIKISGGVRTVSECFSYLALAEDIMSPDWIKPNCFRFGASHLLDEIERFTKKAEYHE